RHGLDDQLRQPRFALGGGAEAGALADGLGDGGDDARVGVAEDQRAPRADVVEVGVAVEVHQVRPLPAGDEDRLAADGAEGAGRAVHPARDEGAGALERLPAAAAVGWHRWPLRGKAPWS